MRTANIDIKGTTYTLCYSARVACDIEERAGSVKEEMDKLSNGSMTETFWLLAKMLEAGARYDKLEGREPPEIPAYDEIVDGTGSEDFSRIYGAVADALTAGNRAKVEVKPPKKEKGATQAV